MTGMLASVTSVDEAEIVLDAGVDIIDIKNPHAGALGALEINAVKKIVRKVNGKTLTSATIGDIKPDNPKLSAYISDMSDTDVDYVKVGLFDKQASDYFVNTIRTAVNNDIKLVIVLFAEDYQGKESILPLLESGIVGIMLDTREKKDRNLLNILDKNELSQFIGTAKEYKLLTGLAGSLRFKDIQTLLSIKPDYLGFRGALCAGNDRVKTIDLEQVKKIRNAVHLK